MEMPGRKYQSSSSYRYGFNGKENDSEVKGTGNQQDYGMRVYSARIAKFLSVDPLYLSYPNLSTYQFASNRPIDGIDIDGAEYGDAKYNVTIKNGLNSVTSEFVWYNSANHGNHGPLGMGVNYMIKINNLDNNTSSSANYFVSRDGFGKWITQYGNYMGSASLVNFNAYSGKSINNTYRYDAPAINFVDQKAKVHDQGYDRVGSVGANGLFDDFGTTPYDIAALEGWNNYLKNNPVGSTDPFNGQSVTKDARNAAWRGSTLFATVVAQKKSQISTFMIKNYDSEAMNCNNSTGEYQKQVDYNYNLFLQKYMTTDEDGNYIRNESMWTKDENDNWTPNTPKR